jgi:hypothetical protein
MAGACASPAQENAMKLLRWTIAGASFYVIYKYSIGKKAKGEGVLVSPEKVQADVAEGKDINEPAPAKPKAKTKPRRKTSKPEG